MKLTGDGLRGVLAILGGFALAGGLAACTGAAMPVFDAPQVLAGQMLVLTPELRIGAAKLGIDRQDLVEVLDNTLRQTLSGRGIPTVSGKQGGKTLKDLRQALLQAWVDQRAASSRRFRKGQEISLGDAAQPVLREGTSSVSLSVLTVSGSDAFSGGSVPIPPDEMIPLPEERPDYSVPKPGSVALSETLSLDLLVVDVASGRVLLHRRVAYPLAHKGDLLDALRILSREATRGLTAQGGR